MATFRLEMARQLGEKIAGDFGFSEFPVRPREIANKKDIPVQAKPPEIKGVSGAMIFAGGKAQIIYSKDLNNEGFENFSISHELGHYFLPGHPEEIQRQGGTHLSRANFTESSSIELEADHFAAGLLLPSKLTKKFLSRHQIGLEGVIGLAGKAECSLNAAAIATAQADSYPVAIIVSRGDAVAYAFPSESFKDLGKIWLPKDTPLPDSLTKRFNSSASNVSAAARACGETYLGDWFGGPKGITLDEEVVGLGSYGFTLTVLSTEAQLPTPVDEEDEEEHLEKSWTAKFAYGR